MKAFLLLLLPAIALIAGCDIVNDDSMIPIPVGGGSMAGTSSGSAVRPTPASPIAPPFLAASQWNPETETREWHASATREDCENIEKALQNQGLDIRLVERQRTRDPLLPWACIFEGPDADPSANRWSDRRSEQPDESAYP